LENKPIYKRVLDKYKVKGKKGTLPSHLHNLPDETENQVGLSFNEISGSNVDNVATNRLGGVDGEGLVFGDSEGVEVLLVNDAFINGFGNSIVDEFAEGEKKQILLAFFFFFFFTTDKNLKKLTRE